MTKPSRSPYKLWYLSFAAALAATCRSYEPDPPDALRGGGTSTGGDGRGGAIGGAGEETGGMSGAAGESVSGASGDGGRSGNSGNGGRAGNATGGRSGAAGTNTGGDGGGTAGFGGESGDGGEGGTNTRPAPGMLGGVRLLVDGMPRCGGSLITNGWVLTADQCVSDTDEKLPLVVGFGMDSSNFQQTRPVTEIQRFPGNEGTDSTRGRDVLLLGVERPFEIDGKTSGYHRPLWHGPTDYLLGTHRCVGWDLRVSLDSPDNELHEETVTAFAVDKQVNDDGRPAGDRIWWLNTSSSPNGVLPMPADMGSGCFHNVLDVVVQTTVHSKNPPLRRNGDSNAVEREAYSVVLGERGVRAWIRSALFETGVDDLGIVRSAGVCAPSTDRIELFGIQDDGMIGWWTWNGTWNQRETLDPPPIDTELSNHPLAVYCTSAGGIELFATDSDGAIWWQRMDPKGRWNQWRHIDVETTPVNGVAVAGVVANHFHLFAVATTGELRYAEYRDGWTNAWTNLGGACAGTPAVRMPHAGRIYVFVRGYDNHLYAKWLDGGNWYGFSHIHGPVDSDPMVVGWNHLHLDVLTRSASERITHAEFQGFWWGEPVETDNFMPRGAATAVARRPGRLDVFVAQGDGTVWQGYWPRVPRRKAVP